LKNREDIPGDLEIFGDEQPMSTTEVRELLKLSIANFSHHFGKFKNYIIEVEGKEINPIIKG
jgi:hypothetical protein